MDAFEKECQRCLRIPPKPKEPQQQPTNTTPAPQMTPVLSPSPTISAPPQSSRPGNAQGAGGAGIVVFLVILCWICWPQISTLFHSTNIEKIEMGMTSDQVRDAMGDPDRTQKMEQAPQTIGSGQYAITTPGLSTEYWYYGNYQVCFEDDRVTAINRY